MKFAAAAFVAILAVTGCSGPTRMAAPPEAVSARAEPSAGDVRYAIASDPSSFAEAKRESIRRELAWWASSGHTGPLPPVSFLAISGGGDDGAFAAGLLNGWTAHGDRPEFKAVTGISTGALIAPFAFLGPRYDSVLKALYTNISQRDIFRRRFVTSALLNDALSDT
ncbi:MAG TPA: patatin-like phospholipase family protein, partial [Caulobacteraceae bacterium]|nr:patatin-like phospholipase family protein [Caulobacteraceae bacterium]